MPYSLNNVPAKNDISGLPFCSIKEPFWMLVIGATGACVMIYVTMVAFFTVNGSYVFKIVLAVFSLFAILALPHMFHIFYLYQNSIVIKYPLSLSSKADEILALTALEKVVFIRKNNKTHVAFRINGKDLKYNIGNEKAEELFTHLTRLGVKTEKEEISR